MVKIVDKWVRLILRTSTQKSTLVQKILWQGLGVVFFMFLVPGLFIWLAGFGYNVIILPRMLELIIGFGATILGLFFVFWTMLAQWTFGQGTTAHLLPTQKLVIVGPYKLCRNPMHLGGILYFLGVPTLFSSLLAGMFAALIIFILGFFYHRFVEEKELELRFGDEYKEYKRRTPFLVPRMR